MKNARKHLIQAIMILISATVLTSCTTCPKEKVSLEWTAFPDPIVDGKNVVEYDAQTKVVSMPLWYWINICKYVSDTETNIEILEGK